MFKNLDMVFLIHGPLCRWFDKRRTLPPEQRRIASEQGRGGIFQRGKYFPRSSTPRVRTREKESLGQLINLEDVPES
ncbi:hypothetical protein CEXT_248411 [Caerostris extrusa]|uniref:Uncharacterized protein n=1 Tax=Caerostris extrusa TaxID=172846 RepID=A0AAV4MDD6_CAEEX|nr:hypothetical protein CEXT_248411 [Caerostris extrusa]